MENRPSQPSKGGLMGRSVEEEIEITSQAQDSSGLSDKQRNLALAEFMERTSIFKTWKKCQFAADRVPAFAAKVYHRFSPKGYHFASVSAAPMSASDSCGWTN